MDALDFCKGIEMELTAWKAKVYDAIRKVEALSSGDREKVLPNIQDINMIVTELRTRSSPENRMPSRLESPEKRN